MVTHRPIGANLNITKTIVTCIVCFIVLSIGINSAIGFARATYYEYGTCQSKNLTAFGAIYYPTGIVATSMYVYGHMNSDFVLENSGGPYIQYDYIEFDGNLYPKPGGGTALINVGYQTGTGNVYYVITNGTNVQVTISLHNSTTISFNVDKVCTVQLIVDSNQFLAPDASQTYTVSLQALSGVTNSTTLGSC